MDDYKKQYLQSVRQLSIRQQNTKSKAGTLPLYAYQTARTDKQHIYLLEALTGVSVPEPDNCATVMENGCALLLSEVGKYLPTSLKAGSIIIGVLMAPYLEGDKTVIASVYANDGPCPLTLTSCGKHTVPVSDIHRELSGITFQENITICTITESQYEELLNISSTTL